MGRDYTTARTVLGFLEIISWVALLLGALIALAGGSSASRGFGSMSGLAGMYAIMPGIALAFLGLLGAAICQAFRAVVDQAQTTDRLLDVAQEQLRLLKAAPSFAQAGSIPLEPNAGARHAEATNGKTPAKQPTLGGGEAHPVLQSAIEYRGHTIAPMGNGVLVEKQYFASLPDAKQHVDRLLGTVEHRPGDIEHRRQVTRPAENLFEVGDRDSQTLPEAQMDIGASVRAGAQASEPRLTALDAEPPLTAPERSKG
ncbi:hypothetical protein P2H44_11325 [Albimonas sp. CAU 1670]|uniref:hypothetical protein n=1 Tax=Albimonas sp. CAU 1670 TaxID=3032599 RepID=UPI0023DB2EA6|nr:hypothetical protein [Albimonas sp. CAU 1670]MDF2233142.1 hypothetical protein [Albimonas sp. CAU 1670]